jgi:predicted ATPase/class 3 adenylate cyclase
LDPEDLRAILTGYFNLMTQQIRRHGGTVEKYIGDAVMAVFGTPITHEDDPDRAIRAALDMQDALADFNKERQRVDPDAIRLQMRIGINTGEVALPGSEHQRQDFLITGDAVNVAARLQQVAMPDTILVGERTYQATRLVFNFQALAPLQLRGKQGAISAYVVQGHRDTIPVIAQHPRGIDGRQVQLVGRVLELTLLHTNYARVQAEHNTHLITLLGAPGIGKTRLVREFIAREEELARNTTPSIEPLVLQGRCPPYGEGITYWPLIEILRSLVAVQESDSDEMLRQRFTAFVSDLLTRTKHTDLIDEVVSTILRSVGQNLGGTPEQEKERDSNTREELVTIRVGQEEQEEQTGQTHRERTRRDSQRGSYNTVSVGTRQTTQVALWRAWRVFLESLAQRQPLIIVIDDLQWADEALLDLLAYLTDRITTVPILFLCPARPDFFERRRDWGGGQRNFTTIELDALSQEESNELVDALLDTRDIPEVLRHTILARAEGNPFFVEEIVRMFIDQGILVRGQDETGQDVWRFDSQHETRMSNFTTLVELPDDNLINMHYTLPLPRVPDTIQGVLAARVDLLPPTEKLLLQHAAIAGRTFWLSSLLELATSMTRQSALGLLESLMQRDFLLEERDGRVHLFTDDDRMFSFKHVLIRDVVYNNIPRTRRSQEHARLAFWIEEKTSGRASRSAGVIELLAYHYQQALLMWSSAVVPVTVRTHEGSRVVLNRAELRRRTIHYLLHAGDEALDSYYTLRALQAYNDAYELLQDDERDTSHHTTLATMHEKLGDAYSQRGNSDEAWKEYRLSLQLLTSGDTTPKTADLLYLYERLAELSTRWLGSFDNPPDAQEARHYVDTGLQLIEDQPSSRERVAFLTYQAFWYIRQLETTTHLQRVDLAEQALSSGHEALRLAEQLNNPSALSVTLDALGFIYTQYHHYKEVHQIQHRRQKLEAQLTDREELNDLYISLGKIHEEIGDYPTALMWFGRAWNNAQTMESPSMLLNSMAWRMWTWLQWNRWQEAHQVACEILHLLEQYPQDEKRQLWALETLATIEYRTGNQEQGDTYARQYKRLSDQIAARTGDPLSASSTTMHAIYLARQDWTHALADYKEKLQASEPLPSPSLLTTLAELLVTTGADMAEQEAMCERALTLADQSGARRCLAIAFRARGRMYIEQENWNAAQDDLCQALNRSEALDIPWERGITLYYLGILYKRRAAFLHESAPDKRATDLARARHHFEQALGFFEAMHALPSIERVRLAMMQDHNAPV